jgi:hypothetical protein
VESVGGNLTVFDLQSVRGLVFSSHGIPRIIEWMPIGATRNVSVKETPAIIRLSPELSRGQRRSANGDEATFNLALAPSNKTAVSLGISIHK